MNKKEVIHKLKILLKKNKIDETTESNLKAIFKILTSEENGVQLIKKRLGRSLNMITIWNSIMMIITDMSQERGDTPKDTSNHKNEHAIFMRRQLERSISMVNDHIDFPKLKEVIEFIVDNSEHLEEYLSSHTKEEKTE